MNAMALSGHNLLQCTVRSKTKVVQFKVWLSSIPGILVPFGLPNGLALRCYHLPFSVGYKIRYRFFSHNFCLWFWFFGEMNLCTYYILPHTEHNKMYTDFHGLQKEVFFVLLCLLQDMLKFFISHISCRPSIVSYFDVRTNFKGSVVFNF